MLFVIKYFELSCQRIVRTPSIVGFYRCLLGVEGREYGKTPRKENLDPTRALDENWLFYIVSPYRLDPVFFGISKTVRTLQGRTLGRTQRHSSGSKYRSSVLLLDSTRSVVELSRGSIVVDGRNSTLVWPVGRVDEMLPFVLWCSSLSQSIR